MGWAESKIIFVCPRPPDPQFTPPGLKKLYCVLAGKKIFFYRLPPKRPIACRNPVFITQVW